ncbi:MAG: hypothetical protein MJ016_06765 [Victivallaceae bacterium]|nr:hypothetical protein [Victivallaceae bacterium]
MAMTIAAVREFAAAAKLKKRELLDDDDAVLRDCNGIGAAWFPAWLRRAISAMHPVLYAASFIHDREYAIGGGAPARLAADWRFLRNGIASGIFCYGFFSVRNAITVMESLRFFFCLRLGGSFAWRRK